MSETVRHSAALWRWQGEKGSWFFLTIDGEAGESLKGTALLRKVEGQRRGFGSIKVVARIGGSEWQTSVFPDKTRGWLLPVKAAVRKAEGLDERDEAEVTLTF